MEPSHYGPFPYIPIHRRPRLVWPGNARVAVWVIPNIEFFPLNEGLAGHPFESKGSAPTVRPWAQRDYGNRVGIWRIMDVLDKRGIRASATVNSDICIHHPEILEAAVQLDWELLGHNETNTRRLSGLSRDEEVQTIGNCVRLLSQFQRPVGWLGAALAETWSTLEILLDQQFEYVADWVNDDQPYAMNVNAGSRSIVSVPYSYEVNDSPFFHYKNGSVEEFEKLAKRQFDVLYEEGAESGRVMAICLHPFIIGVPHRIKVLDSILAYIQSFDDVWFATGAEIARHYRQSVGTE